MNLAKGAALAAIISAVLDGRASAQSYLVTVNANTTDQTIDGFGGAQPGGQEAPQDFATPFYNWPASASTQALDASFSDWSGIGLTILRMKVSPTLEPSRGVWNDTDSTCLANGTNTYVSCSISAPCPGGQTCVNPQAWIMTSAVSRGPVKIRLSTRFSGWILASDGPGRGECLSSRA